MYALAQWQSWMLLDDIPRVLDGYFTDEVTVIFFDPYGKTCGWVINGTHGKVENIQCDMSIKN